MKGDISVCAEVTVIRITLPLSYELEFKQGFKEQVFSQPGQGYVGIEGISRDSEVQSVIRVRVRTNEKDLFYRWLTDFASARDYSISHIGPL